MKNLLIEAELRDLRNQLENMGVSKNEVTIVISELSQHTCSVVNGVLLFNN